MFEPPETPDTMPSSPEDTIGRGAGLAIALHLIQFLLVPIISAAGSMFQRPNDLGLGGFVLAIAAWSLTQFLYLGPAAWLAWRRKQREKMKGILIVAGVGVLLNGGCDLVLISR